MADGMGTRFYAKLQYLSLEDKCVSLYSPFWVVNETEFPIRLALQDWEGQGLAGQPPGVCAAEWAREAPFGGS